MRFVATTLGLILLCSCKPSAHRAGGPSEGESAQTQNVAASNAPRETLPSAPASQGTLPAFPGAEGYGARTTGGRGGIVCVVTSLAKDGAGSFASCLARKEPRTIVFRVGGVIEGPFEMTTGNVTIAGQTAPGGITIKGGLVCDNVYDKNDCSNVIIRHVRFRGGAPDSLRLGGTHDVIVDHASLSTAEDENVELTRSRRVTLQYSVVSEPRGDHYKWGGVLINYSKDVMSLDELSLHHMVWNGVAGRLPELSCEENQDGPGKTNCAGRTLHIDLVNNVMWDAQDPIWFNRCTGTNEGNDCPPSPKNVLLDLNLIGNVIARRSAGDADAPLLEPHAWEGASHILARDNRVLLGPRETRFEKSTAAKPHALSISAQPSTEIVSRLAAQAGAFPRDAMDKRLASYLTKAIDARPAAWKNEKGVEVGDGFTAMPTTATRALPDSDDDGMPDAWETAHGLDPRRNDANSLTVGKSGGGAPGAAKWAAGYTAIECYLNELAERRILEP